MACDVVRRPIVAGSDLRLSSVATALQATVGPVDCHLRCLMRSAGPEAVLKIIPSERNKEFHYAIFPIKESILNDILTKLYS